MKANSVPMELTDILEKIMARFTIRGSCDAMYIANTIAWKNGFGDGMGTFFGPVQIKDPDGTAKCIQGAYGCNIMPEEIPELATLLTTGRLNKEATVKGLWRFIRRCKLEIKRGDDTLREDYLKRCIDAAQMTLGTLVRRYGT